MKKLLILLLSTLLFISCSTDTKTNNVPNITTIKNISIPFQDHGYSQHASQLIVSQDDFDRFLTQVANTNTWNKKSDFLTVLQDENIDFKNYNLLFYRITETSSMIQLTIKHENMSILNNEIYIPIERSTSPSGTMNMNYYALSYKIKKEVKSITFDDALQKVIIENKKSNMIVPQNCKAWFDGCNNCEKKNDNTTSCTEMACVLYNPQNFKCTTWEK